MDNDKDVKFIIESCLLMIEEIERIVKKSRVSLEATYKPPPKHSSSNLIDRVAEDINIGGKQRYLVEFNPGVNVVRDSYRPRMNNKGEVTAAIVTDADSGRIFLVKVEEVVRKQ